MKTFFSFSALVYALCWVLAKRLSPINVHDPGRYYHLAIARVFSQTGWFPTGIPQVEDLGWAESFPGQHFLFSALTGAAYRLAGETGVLTLCLFFSTCVLYLLFVLLRSYLPGKWAVGFTLTFVLLNPYLAGRLLSPRPHVFAIASVLLLLLAFLRTSPRLAAIAGWAFAWGYYAYYVPLLVIGLGCFAFAKQKSTVRCGLAAMGGIFLGTVIHPYFPGNVLVFWNSIWISFSSDPTKGTLEMAPFSSAEFLKSFGVYLLILSLAGVAWGRSRYKDPVLTFLIGCATSFWLLAGITPRGAEYAAGFAIVLLGPTLQVLSADFKRARAAVLVLGVLALLPRAISAYALPIPKLQWNNSKAVLEAVNALPSTKDGKVFNCTWSDGSYILYQRPNLRFVDLLDPYFLKVTEPSKYALREMLNRGEIAFPQALLTEVFKADYVLCDEPAVISLLERDPHFTRLYPEPKHSYAVFPLQTRFVYTVRKEPLSNWVQRFEIRKADANAWARVRSEKAYLNLGDFRSLKPEAIETLSNGNSCLTLRPANGEMLQHRGASWLAVGGGPEVSLRLNGRDWFDGAELAQLPESIRYFIPLPRPLSGGDEITARVCAPPGSGFAGLSVSLWTEKQIQEVCAQKPQVFPEKAFTPTWVGEANNCMGKTATRR